MDTRSIPAPGELRRRHAASERARERVAATRTQIRDCLHGRDTRRLLVIVGPCSLHDLRAALEYAARLRKLAAETEDALLVVMRTFLEKPRTALGWPGLVHDPGLDGSGDVALGLELARSWLLEILELGVPCASELIDPVLAPFYVDLLSWAAIGARTSESQTHRHMASGLDLPVAFKNGTDGRVDVALHGMRVARATHPRVAVADDGSLRSGHSRGNPDAHLALRGGKRGPNFDAQSVAQAASGTRELGLARGVLVDCSHDNSGKNPARQPGVCRAVLEQWSAGRSDLLGVMLESHLVAGHQRPAARESLAHGISITDACLGWEDTERALMDAAAAIRDPSRTRAVRG